MEETKGELEEHTEAQEEERPEGGTPAGSEPAGIRVFFKRHGAEIGLVVLIGYVILLGIGVIAEVFKIQWILDWWIFTPPRR